MFACNQVSTLFKQSNQVGISDHPLKPLPVLSSYSGFVPNQVFNKCSPLEIMVYAVIQYLSFFSIKCSTQNIAKNLNASNSGIKNAINSLCNRSFIKKSHDRTYLFKKFNTDTPTELVDAKSIALPPLGYWFPVEILKSKKITNQEKKAFALMKSLTRTKERKIDMAYISTKLQISRRAASPLIGVLLNEKLISRDRPHFKTAYTYQSGGQEMSIYKKDLSTGTINERPEIEQINQKGTQNCTSKGTQNFPSLSINKSNKYLIDIGKEQRASTTYESGQKKSLFFLKEVIDFLVAEIENQKTHYDNPEEERDILETQYTQACIDGDIDKIQELREKLATSEVKNQRHTHLVKKSKHTREMLDDYLFCLENNRRLGLSENQVKMIGLAARQKIDLVNYSDKKTRKMAWSLTFNSLILDIVAQHPNSQSMTDAVNICLKSLSKDGYDLNYQIISWDDQRKCSVYLSASNQ